MSRILRPLGDVEAFLFQENITFTNAFLVDSKIDFNTKQSNLNTAISSWKDNNPLLKCKIHASTKCLDQQKHYFQVVNEEGLKQNVFYFSYSAADNKDSTRKEAFTLLASQEAFHEFDFENDLLWRLIFLK